MEFSLEFVKILNIIKSKKYQIKKIYILFIIINKVFSRICCTAQKYDKSGHISMQNYKKGIFAKKIKPVFSCCCFFSHSDIYLHSFVLISHYIIKYIHT